MVPVNRYYKFTMVRMTPWSTIHTYHTYRVLQTDKLLNHAMKVVERVFEHRIRQQIETDDMQFGFTKGKRTTDTTFVIR